MRSFVVNQAIMSIVYEHTEYVIYGRTGRITSVKSIVRSPSWYNLRVMVALGARE